MSKEYAVEFRFKADKPWGGDNYSWQIASDETFTKKRARKFVEYYNTRIGSVRSRVVYRKVSKWKPLPVVVSKGDKVRVVGNRNSAAPLNKHVIGKRVIVRNKPSKNGFFTGGYFDGERLTGGTVTLHISEVEAV